MRHPQGQTGTEVARQRTAFATGGIDGFLHEAAAVLPT